MLQLGITQCKLYFYNVRARCCIKIVDLLGAFCMHKCLQNLLGRKPGIRHTLSGVFVFYLLLLIGQSIKKCIFLLCQMHLLNTLFKNTHKTVFITSASIFFPTFIDSSAWYLNKMNLSSRNVCYFTDVFFFLCFPYGLQLWVIFRVFLR